MKKTKVATDNSVAARFTTLKTSRTLSETTYRAALSAMKQAIRKDDLINLSKDIERKK